MEYLVNPWNNFCRIFRLPRDFPNQYCSLGGVKVAFIMLDWFNPVSRVPQAGISKHQWEKEVGPTRLEDVKVNHEELKKELLPFLLRKEYVRPDQKYLFISDFGMSFVFFK